MIRYRHTIPDKVSFLNLYRTTGWNESGRFDEDRIYQGITRSWHIVCAYDPEERLIGMGRIVSDGGYQVFITDMIVTPSHQGKGIGRHILERLLAYCKENEVRWVQLACARGKKGFYEKFGFVERPIDGPGMHLFM
ncbi:GNAT family N-acetyltransferase [Laceyella putida]|uniref:GNAT family N-acetyltransferase n=1 Tax=Laceyella putida TaxID=110101 RepID=A0ABW2RN86_9BACL